MRSLARYGRWGIVLVAVGALAALALWPTPVPVDVVASVRGPLTVTIDEEGETRVRNRYVVSAPVTGRVLRIALEPGDRVTQGASVARLRAEPPALLDARRRAEAEAGLAAARAALGRAEAELRRAVTTLELATADLTRQRELSAAQLTTAQALDAAESNTLAAQQTVKAAEFAVASARAQAAQAEARVAPPASEAGGRILTVPAPVDGVVLRRLRESESFVVAGEPLVEIGDPASDLELVADLLSTDAVKVMAGARVLVEQWGGDQPLTARVRRIEPSGFTKVSALGVEEQRVNVIMDFTDQSGAWTALGDGYRVEVRIVMWEGADVLKVPTSALVRQADGWTVFALDGDRVRRVPVQVGQRNSEETEITSGLEPGRRVVVHPSDQVDDGVLAEIRTAR